MKNHQTLAELYREFRKPLNGYAGMLPYCRAASQALACARHKIVTADAQKQWEEMEDDGLVRVRVEPDEMSSLEDMEGDCFNPEVNPEINSNVLKREQKLFRGQIEQDGIWGYIVEVFVNGGWYHLDSCWGFTADYVREGCAENVGYHLSAALGSLEVEYAL